jgi:hypothetical protein
MFDSTTRTRATTQPSIFLLKQTATMGISDVKRYQQKIQKEVYQYVMIMIVGMIQLSQSEFVRRMLLFRWFALKRTHLADFIDGPY